MGQWSLRKLLIAALLLAVLLPALVIGGASWYGAQQSITELAESILTKSADRVETDAERFFEQADSVMNGMIAPEYGPARFEQPRAWLMKPESFEPAAFSLARQSRDASSVYFGRADGAFFGVKQEVGGARVSVKAPTDDRRTFYRAMAPGDRSLRQPAESRTYDPLSRPWYRLALVARDRVFTEAYPSASTREMIVTLAQPVLGGASNSVEGVFAVDLFLARLTEQMRARRVSARSVVFILDEKAELVGISTDDELVTVSDGQATRLKPSVSKSAMLRATYEAFAKDAGSIDSAGGSTAQLRQFDTDQGRILAIRRPFGEKYGMRWTLVVAAPEADFTATVDKSVRNVGLLLLALLVLASLAAALFGSLLGKRFARLRGDAAHLGQGAVPDLRESRIADLDAFSRALNGAGRQIQDYRVQVERDAQDLKAANENLESRVQERTALLEASREEALEAARAKSAFLATMSHEIRTPLNGVVGMSALLAETRLSSEQREYLKTIRLSSDQLLGVINDILDFSKIESGKMELEAEPLRLRDVVEEACDIVAPRAREKGLELIVDVAHDRAELPQGIRSDVTRIRQVLINYLNNAIKFTEKGDIRVRVSVEKTPLSGSEPWVIRFGVKDTGIGIPADRMNRLFQSFSQVDSSTTRKYGGTGLGLAICARLAHLMGGEVGVESEPGQGSNFWFTLRAQACGEDELPSTVREFGDWSGKRVLIVDDNATNLHILERQLSHWNLNVQSVASAAHALEALEQMGDTLPEAIITDMHMPDTDGAELAQKIKANPRWAGIPLLLLSSGVMAANEVNAKLFRARLLKPARESQMFDALALALGGEERSDFQPSSGLGQRKGLRILVADDNAVNLKVACAMLDRLGYDSLTANDGLEAVEATLAAHSAKEADPSVGFAAVLMDLNMPNMDGIGATRELVTALGDARPPVIALTAAASAEDRERCLASGMCDFLTKPLQLAQLASTLERWTRTAGIHTLAVAAAAAPQTPQAAPQTPKAAAPDEEVLFDFSRLAQFRDFDDEELSLTRGVTDTFLTDAPQRVADMVRDLGAGDLNALSKSAHALKGASSNVGATALQMLCADLEVKAKAGQAPADPQAIAAQLQALWPRTRDALSRWLVTPV